jgi:hypothetical protein
MQVFGCQVTCTSASGRKGLPQYQQGHLLQRQAPRFCFGRQPALQFGCKFDFNGHSSSARSLQIVLTAPNAEAIGFPVSYRQPMYANWAASLTRARPSTPDLRFYVLLTTHDYRGVSFPRRITPPLCQPGPFSFLTAAPVHFAMFSPQAVRRSEAPVFVPPSAAGDFATRHPWKGAAQRRSPGANRKGFAALLFASDFCLM